MTTDAQWLQDPTGGHELRYWDGASWTEHVSDAGTQAVDPLPVDVPAPPPPAPAASVPPPPPTPGEETTPAAGGGKGGWKDKLKNAAQQAAQQGKVLADQAKTKVAEQQAKKVEQWENDPDTLWFGSSTNAASKATGVSKAFYRVTKDRLWIDTGLLGTRSEYVPLWAVKDLDVRQSVLQRGKDLGDVVLWLEDPALAADQTGAMNWSGAAEVGGHTSGEVVIDDIEGPYQLRELLMPLISEARQKKLMERQSQYLHVNPGPGMVATGMAAPPPPAAGGEPVDVADQLRKLAELRDQGVLTEDEFAAQKAKLLGL